MRDNNEIKVGDLVKMRQEYRHPPEPGTPKSLTFLVTRHEPESSGSIQVWEMTALSTDETFRVIRLMVPDDGNHYRFLGYDDCWMEVEL